MPGELVCVWASVGMKSSAFWVWSLRWGKLVVVIPIRGREFQGSYLDEVGPGAGALAVRCTYEIGSCRSASTGGFWPPVVGTMGVAWSAVVLGDCVSTTALLVSA